MKQLFIIYTIIGLLCAPFIYFSNAEGYRSARSEAQQWGRALGSALYWPSYVFSIEPEIDGKSSETFEKSILEIVEYRSDKLFAGRRGKSDVNLIIVSIGSCLAINSESGDNTQLLYEKLFANEENNLDFELAKKNIMKMMDGYDFSDIVEKGFQCNENLQELSEAKAPLKDDNSITPDNSTVTETKIIVDNLPSSIKNSKEVANYDVELSSSEDWNNIQKKIKESPQSFISDCVEQDVKIAQEFGGMAREEVLESAKESCTIELSEFKNCMKVGDHESNQCYLKIIENRGGI